MSQQILSKVRHHKKSGCLSRLSGLFFVSFLFTNQCITTEEADKALPPVVVKQATIIPNQPHSTPLLKTKITFPPAMITEGYVTRPTAEMRVGPGTQFFLKDQLLTKGTKVVLLERVGPWQKVVETKGWGIGWVHHVTLGKINLNKKPVTMSSDLLPRVFANRALNRAYSFDEKRRVLKATIPKGQSFMAIRYERDKVLVYLPTTNSVAWLEGGFVQ